MPRRAASSRGGRPHGGDAYGRDPQNRVRIAQLAARLIVEHGIADWSLAKRKAARQLMLSGREALPGDDEVEAALAAHHALFGAAEHQAGLRAQREEALTWMRRLAAFRPTLIGGVAAGWATAHSDIRLELVADDAKTVELALINAGIDYRVAPERRAAAPAQLHVETPRGGLRLIVVDDNAQRQRPHRRGDGSPEVRLSATALEALLGASRGTSARGGNSEVP
jgi:hypothetical protein